MRVKNVNNLCEVRQRPGQPINLVDDHPVDLTPHHLKPGQSRAHGRGHRGLNGAVYFACTLFLGWKSSRKSAARSFGKPGKIRA